MTSSYKLSHELHELSRIKFREIGVISGNKFEVQILLIEPKNKQGVNQ